MKSVREHQCERFLIYDHDDLSNLDIEINFLKKIIFCVDFSWKLASKKRLKEILKEIDSAEVALVTGEHDNTYRP